MTLAREPRLQPTKPATVAAAPDAALDAALRLAKTSEASYLPGWCGPTP